MSELRNGQYLVDGQSYPRVSSILKVLANDGLALWRARVGVQEAERISQEAATFGTRLHEQLLAINLGQVEDGGYESYCRAYHSWLIDHAPSVVACERLVVSREHGYAGTLDCLLEIGGELVVADYKTSNVDEPPPTWALQLAAYRLALAEEGLLVKRRLVLQFRKDNPGRVVVHDLTNHKADTLAFLACLTLYRWQEAWRASTMPEPRRRGVERATRRTPS